MIAVLPAMPSTPAVRPLTWTTAQFHRVADTGIWNGRRPILIRGHILEQGSMNPPHADCVEKLCRVLYRLLPSDVRIRIQLPMVLNLDTDPMPDVAVILPAVTAPGTHPSRADWVIEVSDTSLDLDQTVKAELYAEAGIPEYWIVDVVARTIQVLREPIALAAGGHHYRDQRTYSGSERIRPMCAVGCEIAVGDVFG